MCRIVFVFVALTALALAFPGGHGGHGGRGGHPRGPPPPPFLQNVTQSARQDFFNIFNDRNLTKGEIKTKVGEWASANSVSEQVTAFETEMENEKTERRQNITNAVGQLADAISTLNAIEDDESITPSETMQKIRDTIDGFSPELRDLVLAAGPKPGPKGPRGPGGKGGFGGFGGRGAMKGFIGFDNSESFEVVENRGRGGNKY